MTIISNFNKKEKEFYWEHKKIMKKILEKVSLVSALELLEKLKPVVHKKFYKELEKKLIKEISNLK